MMSPESDNETDGSRGGISLLREILALQGELRALASDQARLASLEARQAGRSLIKIMILSLLGVFVALTIWIGMMALILVTLIEYTDLSLAGGLLLLLASNIAVALLLFASMYKQSRHLKFRATLDSLKRQSPDNGDQL